MQNVGKAHEQHPRVLVATIALKIFKTSQIKAPFEVNVKFPF